MERAVRALASEAGMPEFKFTKLDEEKEKRWNIYKKILEKYTNYYHEELVSGKYPEVLEYLEKRKITKREIIFFKIRLRCQITKNLYNQLKKEFNEKDRLLHVRYLLF